MSKRKKEKMGEREGKGKLIQAVLADAILQHVPRDFLVVSIAIRRTQTAIPKEELEMSVVERLEPAAPSPGLLVDEHSQRERDAEKDREERRRRVTCNKKEGARS